MEEQIEQLIRSFQRRLTATPMQFHRYLYHPHWQTLLKNIPDSFLAVDNMEVGHGNRIPLWMFGLLY